MPPPHWSPGYLTQAQQSILRKARHQLPDEIWVDRMFEVWITRQFVHGVPVLWLSIKRRDKEPIADWRELQRVKNELVGPEYEAVQLFPAEDRLVDTANQYHLFAVEERRYRFPFGFFERLVADKASDLDNKLLELGVKPEDVAIAKQKPFE